MLEKLEQLAAADGRVSEALAAREPSRLVAVVEQALLAQPEIFAEAIAHLTSNDVKGCSPDPSRAEQARARGNALFHGGQYGAAIQSYTEALQYQPALTAAGRIAASRLYGNRAAALLRLHGCAPVTPGGAGATRGTASVPCSSAASSAVASSSCSSSSSSLSPSASSSSPSAASWAARAALADARCATQADPKFAKAYYRAASSRYALGDLQGAIADCRRALAAGGAADGRAVGPAAGAKRGCGQGGGARRGGAIREPAAVQLDEASALLATLELELGGRLEARTASEAAVADPVPPPPQSQRSGGGGEAAAGAWPSAAASDTESGSGRPRSTADPRVVVSESLSLGRHLSVAPASSALSPATDVLYDWPLAAVLCKRWRRRGGASGGGSGIRDRLGGGGGCGGGSAGLRCWRCAAALQDGGGGGAVPYPCSYCPMALYCSPYCRDHDLFHTPGGCECGLPWSHLLPEEALLAVRLARRAAAEATEPPTSPLQLPAAAETGPRAVHDLEEKEEETRGGPHDVGAAAAACDPHVTHGSPQPGEVLGRLLTHYDSLEPADFLRTAVLAVTTAAAYRSACLVALQRWQQQRLEPQQQELDEQLQGQEAAAEHQEAAPADVKYERRRRQSVTWLRRLTGAVPVSALRPPEVTAAEVFAMLCRVRVNGIAVRPDAMTSSYDRLALALYPRAALLNHSCAPNLGLRFRRLQLVARTCRTVLPGQPLTISYGPQLGKASRAARRAALKAQYAFTCECEACAPDPQLPDAAKAASTAALEAALWGLKCPVCSNSSSRSSCNGSSSSNSSSPSLLDSFQRWSPAGLPADPRVRALCGGTHLSVDPQAPGSDSGACLSGLEVVPGVCTLCGRRMTAAEEAGSAEVLMAAENLADLAAAALDEHVVTGGGGGGSGGGPPLAAWRQLQRAAELRQRVLPYTNRLMGGTLHQLAAAAVRVLLTAAAPAANSEAKAHLSGNELAVLTSDAVRHASFSVAALQLVYGSCSTEVMYELQLLLELLYTMSPPLLSSPSEQQSGQAATALQRGVSTTQEGHCLYCGISSEAHDAAVHARLAGLLATAVRWCGPSSRAAASREPVTGDRGSGNVAQPLLSLQETARALLCCLHWHLLGEER